MMAKHVDAPFYGVTPVGQGFVQATGPVVATVVGLDGDVTVHRALRMEDICTPVSDAVVAPVVRESRQIGIEI